GFAWSLGRLDNQVSLQQALAHLHTIAHGVDVPVNADFEGGFAIAPAEVGANVRAATATGIAGLSIEDSTGDPANPLFEFVLAAVAPKPVNVLVGGDFTTVAELSGAGVRRISVGGALARAAWTGLLEAAREIATRGTFTALARAVPYADLQRSFPSA